MGEFELALDVAQVSIMSLLMTPLSFVRNGYYNTAATG